MKKLTAITVVLMLAPVLAGAQNRTPIGSRHAVDFGIYYGYGSGDLANHAGGFIDINARRSGLRTRLGFEIDQTALAFCPGAYTELLYLFPLDRTLNIYPLAGVEAEFHDAQNWTTAFDIAPVAGAGLEFQFGGNFGFFLQAKYKYGTLGTGSTFMGQTGFTFAFGPGGRGPREIVATGASLAEALRAKDDADDARRAEAIEKARIKAEQEAAAAKAAAAEEKAAVKKAAENAAAERMAEQMAAAAANSGKVALRLTHEDIFFKNASAVLDVNAWQQIDELVEALKRDTGAKISLCGYADKSEGNEASCLKYAEKRVENISNAFKSKGIDASRISVEIIGSAIAPYRMPESNRVVTVDIRH